MAANDTLDLIFDDPDVVPWAQVSSMVAALEFAQGELVATIIRLKNPTKDPVDPGRVSPRAVLAANPRAGSLVLPLIFEATSGIAGLLTQQDALHRTTSRLPEILSAAADFGTVAMFTQWALFGAKGLVAKVTGASTREPETYEEPAAEAAELLYREGGVEWVERLLAAAERTGCARVRVRSRDIELDLVMKDRPRGSYRLGDPGATAKASGGRGPIVYTTAAAETIPVVARGQNRIAFLCKVRDTARGSTIMLGRSERDMPAARGWLEAQGEFIGQEDVQAGTAIPDAWTRASGIFFITGTRPADFA